MVEQFYTIKNIENREAESVMELLLNPEHTVYVGHFPGMPVVPGVCTLMMVKECAERLTGYRLTYHYLNSCKFLSAIRPDRDQELRLSLEYKPVSEAILSLQAQMWVRDTIVLKLKADLMIR